MFQLDIPEKCKNCGFAYPMSFETCVIWYCSCYKKHSEVDVSAVKIDLNSRPEWCPIIEMNNSIKNMSPDKQNAIEMMANGMKALFSVLNKNKY